MVLTFAKIIFGWLFPISLAFSIFFYQDKRVESPGQKQMKPHAKRESAIRLIEGSIAITILISAIPIIFRYKFLAWIFFMGGANIYLSQIAGTYLSIGIIGKVIQSENTERLSAREYWAIETVAYTLFIFDIYKLPTKLIDFVTNLDNSIISDFLHVTLYVLLLFLYAFLSCALLPVPLICLSKLLIKVNVLLRDKTKLFRIGDYFIKRIDKQTIERPLLVRIVEAMQEKRLILNVIVWVISPILIVTDIFLIIIKIIWSFCLTSIGYIFLLLKMIKRTIGKVVVGLNNLSDRRLVSTSFRVALIISLTLTVISNRYTPLLREYEASTGTLEFVASAILIPVIFEWISSTKRRNITIAKNN